MVKVIATREAGPFLKARTANPRYFRHWYIILVLLKPVANCNTGAPGTGKKTQCTLLCENIGYQHVVMGDVLREKSDDQTYPHAKFVKDCLKEKVNVPKELMIGLLEGKINQGMEEGKWSLVHEFPRCIEELLEFEEKVGFSYASKSPAYV